MYMQESRCSIFLHSHISTYVLLFLQFFRHEFDEGNVNTETICSTVWDLNSSMRTLPTFFLRFTIIILSAFILLFPISIIPNYMWLVSNFHFSSSSPGIFHVIVYLFRKIRSTTVRNRSFKSVTNPPRSSASLLVPNISLLWHYCMCLEQYHTTWCLVGISLQTQFAKSRNFPNLGVSQKGRT